MRFAVAFAPWLVALCALSAWLFVDRLYLLWPPLGFALGLVGTKVSLASVRRGLKVHSPDAPPDAALLLGGVTIWRDIGLGWTDGPALRFACARSAWRIERREIARVEYRALAQKLHVHFARDGRNVRLTIGALVSLGDLPRFHRKLRAWLDGASPATSP